MPRSIDEWAKDRNRNRGGSVGSSIVGAVGGKTGDGSISGSIVGAVGGQRGGSVGGSIAGAVQQQTGQSGGQGSPRSIEEWAQDQQGSRPQTLDEGQRLYEQRKQAQAEAQPWKPTLLWLGEAANQAQQAQLGQQIHPQENATTWEDVKDAWEASRKANRAADYAGRKALINEYNAARHEMGAQRHTPEPEVQRRYEQARDRLYEQERIHGNIGLNANGELQTMSYSFGEGVGNVIGGVMGRVIGGVGGAATWLGEAAARSEYAKSAAQLREMEAFYAMAGNDNASEAASRMADTLTQRAAQRDNLAEFGGAYEFFRKQTRAGNRLVQAAKENQRPVVQMGVDVGSTALEMGFDAVSGIPLVSMGVRVFGGASQEARDAGAGFLEQGAYGAASASIEVMTETIGGLKLYGGGQLDEVLEPALREIAGTSGGYALVRALYTMVQEGNEEVLSDLLQPLAQSIYNGQSVGENYSELQLKDILYDWLLGAAAAFGGAVVESGSYAQDYKAMREMQQDLNAQGVETGRMTDEQLRQAYILDKAGVNVAGLQSAENRAVGGETIGEAYENMTQEQREAALVNMLAAQTQRSGQTQTPTDEITRENAQEILRESLGEREAESAERILDLGSESNLREQAIAYHTIATEYGQAEGRSVEEALRSNVRGALNDTQVQHAYAYGESLRKSGQTVGVNGQVTEQGAQTGKPVRRAGLVTAGTFADGNTTYKAADLSKADARDLRILNDIAKAQGVDFVLYESELGEADAEGRRRYIGANGAYRDGVVYLDINAGLTGERTEGGKTYSIGQRALLVTAAHELTHHLEHSNAAMYRQLRSFVTERLGGSDSFISYVREAMAREDIGVEAASREVVARACEEVLLDENAIRELQGKKPTLWEQIKEWVREFVKKFQSASGEAVEMRQYADELRRLWLDTATETPTDLRGDIVPANAPAVDPANAPEETFTASGANGQQYSLRSMSHDIAEGKMFSDLRQYCGWTQEQTDTLKNNLQGLVQYMSQYAGIVDMNESYDKGNRPYSAYKPNSDPLYTISLDFSTLCRKRLLTQHIMEQLQLQLIDAKSGKQGRILTAEEQMAIRDMLEDYAKQEKALKVACAMCYVEAARLKAPAQMERIIGDMGSVMIDYYAKQSDLFKGQTRSAQNRWKAEHGYSATDTKAAMTNKDRSAFNKFSKEFRASYTPTAAEMEVVERARNLPRTAFLSAENLTRLYTDEQTRDIYKAYTNKLRESTHSKGLETDIPYYYGDSAESVSDTFIRNVVRENGMRFSSWSDFQMKHVLDMMTAVIELSTRKCSMHGYTKFLEAVRLFGRTGMMFNMSGVPAGNGFTEDGQLAFSKTESVLVYGENGEYDAIRARREFPETAGLQCIGISRAHILALLDSDIIDYIIPYHTSGLNAKLRKMAGINNWDDFQGFQTATVDKSIEQGNCPNDIWHKEPVFSEFFAAAKDPANGYKDGEAGIDTMRRAAEQYKQMCRERGLRPKFSWANSKVDANFADHPDYWKLLIDRKMINQETGKLIEQKPVEPNFDFAEIKRAVKEEVESYDPSLEDRALDYIKGHLDELPGRVKELKAKGSQNAHEAQRPTTLDRHVMDMSNGLYAAEASGLRNPSVTGNDVQRSARGSWNSLSEEERKQAIQENKAFNRGQTETGAPLVTLKGSPISRGGTLKGVRYPVGKVIGERLYIHKSYADKIGDIDPKFRETLTDAEQALREEYPDFEYNCLNYHPASGEIQFQEAPDFDTAREPVVGRQVNVQANGDVSGVKSFGQIWHHKWQWVDNGYKGFNVRDSWAWSKRWLSTILGASKGGSMRAWNEQLAENGLPEDGGTTQFSVRKTAPVQPSDGSWQRGHTEEWFRQNGYPIYSDVPEAQREANEEAESEAQKEREKRSGGHGTQIEGTEETYKKLFESIKEQPKWRNKWRGMRVLDASSGYGYGTKAGRGMGFNVTDIEPFWSTEKYDAGKGVGTRPDYEDYSHLQDLIESGELEPFDFIVSNAVLNVVPQDTRDDLVVAMGQMLKPGGQMFVNVIDRNYAGAVQSQPHVQTKTLKNGKVVKVGAVRTMEGDYSERGNLKGRGHETFVWKSNSVQKVFSYPELEGYLRDALGPGYTIEKSPLGMTGALVTKTAPAESTETSAQAAEAKQQTETDTTQHSARSEAMNAEGELTSVTDSAQFKRWFKGSKIVDEDGNPLVVYHGTDAEFTAFDMSKGRANMDIQGAFFSPWEIDAAGYGSNVGAYYLSIKNPAPEGIAYKALNRFKGQNNAGVKARKYLEALGYDGVNNGGEEYIAFYPEQIKSATDNIGTFDSNNPDTRYSQREADAMTDREILMLADAYGEGQTELAEFRDAMARYQEYDEAAQEHLQKLSELQTERKAVTDMRTSMGEITPQEKQQRLDALDKQIASERREATKAEQNAARALSRVTQLEKGRALQDILQRERAAQRQRTRAQVNESTRRRDTRRKVEKLAKELQKRVVTPSEKRYIPKDLMRQTVDVLQAINLDSSRPGTKSGEALRARLLEMQERYRTLETDETYKSASYDPTVAEMLKNMVQTVGDTPINKMTAAQLESVYNTLRAMTHVIQTGIKVKLAGEERNAWEVAHDMTRETRSVNKPKDSLISGWVNTPLSAQRMFRRLGNYTKNSAWEKVYRMLNDGQLKMTLIRMEGAQIFADLIGKENKKAYRELNSYKDKDLVDVGLTDENGNSIKISHGMMVSLYMHLLNEQNARHVARGGLTIPELKGYYKGADDRGFGSGERRAVGISAELAEARREQADAEDELREAKQSGDAEAIQQAEDAVDAAKANVDEILAKGDAYLASLRESIEKQLTDYERKWIEATQELMDGYSKDRLNETTLEVYGIKKARVEHYFPIKSDRNFTRGDFEAVSRNMSLENVGFMKERVEGTNPMYLMDVADVVNTQISNVAQYCGLMPAIRSFNKIWNKSEAGNTVSLKDTVNQKFGQGGLKYVENLIADLQGARRGKSDGLSRFLSGMRGNMAGANLTISLNTALAQAASYPTAAAEIGWTPLIKAFFKGGQSGRMISRADRELIAKYTPLLWTRLQGYSTVELGDLAGNNQLAGRVFRKMRFITGWIQAMDTATVGRLWYAAQYYVDAKNPELQKGSDAYYKETAKVFNDIVEKTQPDYTTMQRPDILRNPNELVRSLTMFMSQRLQNFNIVYDAIATAQKYRQDYRNGQANGVTAEDVKQAQHEARRAVVSQIAAGATIVVFKTVAGILQHALDGYRDDDKELTEESISLACLDMFLDTMASNFLWGGELYDVIESAITGNRYYGLEVNGVQSISDILSTSQSLFSMLRDYKTLSWDKVQPKFITLAKKLGPVLGLPIGNAVKLFKGVWLWGQEFIHAAEDGDMLKAFDFEEGVERGAGIEANRYVSAWLDGDRAKMREIIGGLGVSMTSFNSQLSSEIGDRYKDGSVNAAQAARMLQELRGLSNHEAQDKLREWEFEKAHGYAYDKLKQTYIDGGVSEAQAMTFLRETGGKTQSEAERTIKEWKFEKAHGYAYDKLKQTYLNGGVSEAQAMTFLQETGDKTKIEAERTIKEWEFEKAQGYPYDKLKQTYIDGGVSEAQAMTFLQETGDKTKIEAERTMREWKFEKAQGYAYSDLKGWYVDGKVSQADAIRYVQEVTLKGLPDVQETVLHWQCLKDTGIDYDKIDERLQGGEITIDRAAGLWQKYGGMSQADAKLKANYVTACGASPGLKDKLTQGQYNAWYNYARSAGVKVEVYANIRSTANTDEKSNVSQSEAAAAITRALNAGQITRAQAEAIWKSFNKSWTTTYASYAARHK